MSENTKTSEGRDYSTTLFLPKTEFPMRAGLPKREPEFIARWDSLGMYKRLREAAKGREKYVLHDGPPYANGHIHIGTALNKVLKDVITRSMQMLGYDSDYVPGWDCHGLPIEWKIEEDYRAKGRDKRQVPINDFRRECREFAEHWIKVQTEEFRRLGVEGDFEKPYTTMTFKAEAKIARELMKFAMTGQLYRGSKPVMWSVVEHTALAEAEVEYLDYQSDTVFVKFPIQRKMHPVVGSVDAFNQGPGHSAYELWDAHVVIWTTTPWTIPGNRAISFSSKIRYGLYKVTAAPADNWAKTGETYLLAKTLAKQVMAAARIEEDGYIFVRDVAPEELAALTCAHPLAGWPPSSPLAGEDVAQRQEGGKATNPPTPDLRSDPPHKGEGSVPYGFDVPLLDGDHVTDEDGTGFVHTAPSHGAEDFDAWMEKKEYLERLSIDTTIPHPVDADGFFTKDAPGFGPDRAGGAARVIDEHGNKGDANQAVIDALVAAGALIGRARLKHQYPHSWRSKKPIIFRNTPQWFVHMDRPIDGANDTLRTRALNAIGATRFVPASGQRRLYSMIEHRPDWVLSRQRAWGVPITVFVNTDTGEVIPNAKFAKSDELIARIGTAFEAEGADAWFADGAKARFLEGIVDNPNDWEKIDDILDVWFDSGSTHAFCLEDDSPWDLKWPADLYLEGSDQHRGWFHSSLLESCGTRGRAPYDAVLTHGFVMAEDGRKMSKSLGNQVKPQDVINQSGADILRLWVVSSDYSEDLRIGPEILKTNVEAYRKLRNTIRWMLGSLAHFRPEDRVEPADMPELERLMLHRLAELDAIVREGYHGFDFKRITAALSNFMVLDLSAFYFDIRKDALYCDPISSLKRKACLTVLDRLFAHLIPWLAPMLPFTAEEAWLSRFPSEDDSVHLQLFPDVPADWRDDALADKWADIRRLRRVVTGALEIERRDKRIGSSLEAAPRIYVADEALLAALAGVDLAEIAITSQAVLIAEDGPADAFRLEDVDGVAVVPDRAEGRKCARSWKVLPEVGSDPDYPDLSLRDAAAMREYDARAAAE